ncbi:Short-chain dehydrogenase/reductase SDR [Penicillium griseofulvum]|uniref:D-xylose reductase [NAD(P)H] n=1 Tax=Penicillium patulum TaxID=5078 RepID=A0A135L9C5_PENPA|nr:Short-chain dehydrogenase/reductase SDR [Penicillium griseofulvum]KXG45568.1 Short-chain dehydrogenase/reductase SDR [Penicillium griseofulvum]
MPTKWKLNTGAEIPAIGFGTWQDEGAQEEAVAEALKAGYRHIDTARVYGTEKAVGRGVKKSGIPREELFITTKLWNNKHHPDDVGPALQQSLDDLGMEYVDLFLMHWPVAWKAGEDLFPKKDGKPIMENIDILDTYKAMEQLLKTGKVKAIGVSNCDKSEMERLVKNSSIVPAVHQMECHPWLQQHEFTEWHREHGIHVTHYSPFGNQNSIYGEKGKGGLGKLIEEPVLAEIGEQYNKTGAQVALAWGVTQGHSVLPKSKTPMRIRANLEGDFKLSTQDMEKIEKLNKKLRFNDSSDDKYIMLPAAHGFALVTPASRGLGLAFAQQLLTRTELPVIATARKNCNELQERLLSSKGVPKDAKQRLRILQVDVTDESTISAMADTIRQEYPKRPLRIGLTIPGILHAEKSPSKIDSANALESFKVNSLGPLLLMKHLSQFIPLKSSPEFPTIEASSAINSPGPLWLPSHSLYAMMAARVGSTSDNASGGWYSYRASKAAVFQLAKTFDLHLRAKSGQRAIAVALHPGTVHTDFTKEYWGSRVMLEPADAAEKLLEVLVGLPSEAEGGRGRCWDWMGKEILP